MTTSKWIKNHFKILSKLPELTEVTNKNGRNISLDKTFDEVIKALKLLPGKICFVGNGGSAGIASHFTIDYQKNGGFPSIAFNDAVALTCLSNDLGYENVFSHQIKNHLDIGDILIAISSSGESKNIINAVSEAHKSGAFVITLSGFKKSNRLRKLGHINFYVPADEYGFVEGTHFALLHAILDYSMGLK